MKRDIAVVIPTRNRKESLHRLLKSLNTQELRPKVIVVVDSSDILSTSHDFDLQLNLVFMKSEIKSAAHQRNLGVEYLLENAREISIVSFLDDDVEILPDYFQKIYELMRSDYSICGVSGIAENPVFVSEASSLISRAFIKKHRPGELTRSLINVSPSGLTKASRVDWLIGCSNWRVFVFDYVLFESDFVGQSLFEDVIFSYRASRLGKLVVDPNIVFKHHFSRKERPDVAKHYENWVVNRFRIFRYSNGEFSKLLYFSLIAGLLVTNSLLSCIGKKIAFQKVRGVVTGLLKLGVH